MGTPHAENHHAELIRSMTRMANLYGVERLKAESVLEPWCEVFVNLERMFHLVLKDLERNYRQRIELFCFLRRDSIYQDF